MTVKELQVELDKLPPEAVIVSRQYSAGFSWYDQPEIELIETKDYKYESTQGYILNHSQDNETIIIMSI